MRRTSSGDRLVRVAARGAPPGASAVVDRAAGVRRTRPAAVSDGAAGASGGAAAGGGVVGASPTTGAVVLASGTGEVWGATGTGSLPLRRGRCPGSTTAVSPASPTGTTVAGSTVTGSTVAGAAPAETVTGRPVRRARV